MLFDKHKKGEKERGDSEKEAAPPSTPPASAPAADAPARAPRAPAVVDDPDSPLREPVIAAIKTVYDPEIPVDVYELGLIYGVLISKEGAVHVNMTLTTPHCPAAGYLPLDVKARVKAVAGVTDCSVAIVWDPPWDKDMISEAGRLQLGMM